MMITIKTLLLFAFVHLSRCLTMDQYLAEVTKLTPQKLQERNEHFESEFKKAVEKLRPDMAKGIPKFNVLPLDPLSMGRFSFGPVDLGVGGTLKTANYKELTLTGLKDIVISNLKIDLGKPEFTINITIPKAKLVGKYEIYGTLFKFLPISGTGPFFVEFTMLSVASKGNVKPVNHHIAVDNLELHVDVRKIDLKFDGLLGGGNGSDLANNILKKTAKVLFQAFAPKINKIAGKILQPNLNNFLRSIDIDKILSG